MIPIKLLELKDKEVIGFNKYPEFVKALNNVLGKVVEIVNEQDKSFEGYYLIPIGAISCSNFTKSIINEKTFLLSVINSSIPQYIEKFTPAGITNWMLFKNASTAVIGKTQVIEKLSTREEGNDIMYEDYGYDEYVPIPFDGTYETVAKSILSYLEVYDNWLKSK